MAIPSGESLVLSAMVNVGNVEECWHYGVSSQHFRGYNDEYNWLQNYLQTYGEQPTKDIFLAQFPDFPYSPHEDVRSACDFVLRSYSKNKIRGAIAEAVDLMGMNDVHGAWSVLNEAKPITTASKPTKLLTDMSFFDTWEDDQYGVEVPYRTLQKFTGGLRRGNLWYLAARPGQGKTAHLCNIAVHAVLQGASVIFYSLEMSEMEVRARFHAALATAFNYPDRAQLTMSDILNRRVDMKVYKEFIQFLDDEDKVPGALEIHTPKDGVVTPAIVATRAADYDLNIIDYVTLMKSDSGSSAVDDWRTAASISNRLKEVALSEMTAILAASQINRDGDHGTMPPKLKNLAQSDALGQDGDVVVTMRAMEHNVATYLSLEKNRHGMSGIPFFTTFEPNRGVYRNIDSNEAENLVLEAGMADE